MRVYIVTYNDHISGEGYSDIDKAIAFIEGRSGIEKFTKVTPLHYSDGKNSYKVHDVRVV